MYGWRVRIGLVTPMCESVEHAFHIHAPNGVTVCSMKFDNRNDRKFLKKEMQRIAQMCKGYCLDILILGTTDGSNIIDPEFNQEIRQFLEEETGIKTITAAEAVLGAFEALNRKRTALLSAYDDETTEQERKWLVNNGIDVVKTTKMRLEPFKEHPYGAEAASNKTIYANTIESDFSEAEIFFLSGMKIAAMEVITQLETDLNMPVVTTHQAMLYYALRTLSINDKIDGMGQLFLK